MTLHPDYPYLYETHLHTSQGSRCSRATGAELADACKAAGYTGIFITDHHYGGNCVPDASLDWETWSDEFCKGYYDAKKRGDEIGLDVFFGWESCFRATEFLIYGLSPEWMRAHPELRTARMFDEDFEGMLTPETQYMLVHGAGGMVIHAHPFREAPYIEKTALYPDCIDGVEIMNAAHTNPLSYAHKQPVFDERAKRYAMMHDFPTTAGSDIHTTNLYCGGMAFKRKLESAQDFCRAVLSGEDYILTNGVEWFDKAGNPLNGEDAAEI